jgi:hypothetical protein
MKLTPLIAAAIGTALGIAPLGHVSDADAMCASPDPAFLPRSGEVVPPRPTLYAIVPDRSYATAGRIMVQDVHGIDVKPQIESVSKSDAYEILRIRVPLEEPGEHFTVSWHIGAEAADAEARYRASYRIGSAAPNRARVVGVTHHLDRWTCSYADTIRLELEGTALAYRFAWHDGTTTIVPGDDAAIWRHDDSDSSGREPPATTYAELGHINCLGLSIDPEALDKVRGFELYALFADGSEVRLGSSSAQLGEQGVRLPLELVEVPGVRPSAGPGAGAGEPATFAVISEGPSPWWSAALGALGGAIALAGVAIAAGLRRRAPPAPME